MALLRMNGDEEAFESFFGVSLEPLGSLFVVILDRVQVSQRLRPQKLVAWQDALVISSALVTSTSARVSTFDGPSKVFSYRFQADPRKRKTIFFPATALLYGTDMARI